LIYVNCGDWVESCTAVVEHFDGRLEIIEWTMEAAHLPPVEKLDSESQGQQMLPGIADHQSTPSRLS
jgi:hypothetical protein